MTSSPTRTRSAGPGPDLGIPLIDATRHGQWWMLEKHLGEAPDVNMADQNGRNALHYGALSPHTGGKAITILLEGGVDPARRCRSLGRTPLHYACDDAAKAEVVDVLLRSNRSDANAADRSGCTPLHVACMAQAPAIVASLVRAGASVDARDKDARTPLWIACETGRVDILDLLLAGGAKLEEPNAAGLLPAAAALRALRLRALQFLVRGGMEAEACGGGGGGGSGGDREEAALFDDGAAMYSGLSPASASDMADEECSASVTADAFVNAPGAGGIGLRHVWLLPAERFADDRRGSSSGGGSSGDGKVRLLPSYIECQGNSMLVCAADIVETARILFVVQPSRKPGRANPPNAHGGTNGASATTGIGKAAMTGGGLSASCTGTIRAFLDRRLTAGHRYDYVWCAECCLGLRPRGGDGAVNGTGKGGWMRPLSRRASAGAEADVAWAQRLGMAAAVFRSSHVLVMPQCVVAPDAGVSLTDLRGCLRDGWCRLQLCCALLAGVPISCYFQCGVACQFKHVLTPRFDAVAAGAAAGTGGNGAADGGACTPGGGGGSNGGVDSGCYSPVPWQQQSQHQQQPQQLTTPARGTAAGDPGQGYLGFYKAAHLAKRVLRTQSGQIMAEIDRLWFDAGSEPLDLLCRTATALLDPPPDLRAGILCWAQRVAAAPVGPVAAADAAAADAAAAAAAVAATSSPRRHSTAAAAAAGAAAGGGGMTAVPGSPAQGHAPLSSPKLTGGRGRRQTSLVLAALLPCFDAAGAFADPGDGDDAADSAYANTFGADRQLAVAALLITSAYCSGLFGLEGRLLTSLTSRQQRRRLSRSDSGAGGGEGGSSSGGVAAATVRDPQDKGCAIA